MSTPGWRGAAEGQLPGVTLGNCSGTFKQHWDHVQPFLRWGEAVCWPHPGRGAVQTGFGEHVTVSWE